MKITLEYISGRTNVLHWVRSSTPVTAADIHLMLDDVYGRALLKRVRIEEDDEVRQLSCQERRDLTVADMTERYIGHAVLVSPEPATMPSWMSN
ncbi:MAG: hypothetical protein J5699_04655 [Bacteroidales bacterium]|nr:hypothetical protein [Bacteroidales bacterium]